MNTTTSDKRTVVKFTTQGEAYTLKGEVQLGENNKVVHISGDISINGKDDAIGNASLVLNPYTDTLGQDFKSEATRLLVDTIVKMNKEEVENEDA